REERRTVVVGRESGIEVQLPVGQLAHEAGALVEGLDQGRLLLPPVPVGPAESKAPRQVILADRIHGMAPAWSLGARCTRCPRDKPPGGPGRLDRWTPSTATCRLSFQCRKPATIGHGFGRAATLDERRCISAAIDLTLASPP